MSSAPPGGEDNQRDSSELTVRRTATGYWTVQRGDVALAGAMTRLGAERERAMFERLQQCSERRAGELNAER